MLRSPFGDYSDLVHAVGKGKGVRVSVTLFDHDVLSTGERPCERADLDFDLAEDQREDPYFPVDAALSAAAAAPSTRTTARD